MCILKICVGLNSYTVGIQTDHNSPKWSAQSISAILYIDNAV